MYLGVILHAAIAYKAGYHPRYWIRDSAASTYFFDYLYFWIHSFRMPLFFMLSGFFTALLSSKIGLKAFVWNRFKRIVIPLIFCVILIVPLSVAPFSFSRIFIDQGGTVQAAWNQAILDLKAVFLFQEFKGFQHFWFLLNLIYFYLFFSITKRLGFDWSRLQGMFKSGWILPLSILFAATYLILLGYFKDITPSIWTGLFPRNPQLIYYGLYFVGGIFLYYNRTLLPLIAKAGIPFIVIGTVISVALTWYLNSNMSDTNLHSDLYLFKFLYALQNVTLAIGLMGICLKLFTSESPVLRYMSDASYWVYIVHLAIVASSQLLWMVLEVPVYLRFILTILVTTVISYVSYHFLVRFTLIGEYLHGRRTK